MVRDWTLRKIALDSPARPRFRDLAVKPRASIDHPDPRVNRRNAAQTFRR